jgi:magnesium transporter
MQLSDEIDFYESKLFLKKNIPSNMIEGIYYLKNKTGLYKKLLLLSNEVVSSIRPEKEDRPALQDVRDLHTKLIMLYDQVQDDANNLLNIYLSLSARKTNDVMKILTIFSVFFMPLTFIVGIYGMNFRFMPELSYKWGYPLTVLGMIIMSVVIFVWFKRKKWL